MTGAQPSCAWRFDRLDALRGLAMLWMLAYHFCFDLNLYGYIDPRQAFTRDPFWTVQRSCIVSLFLFCAGIGQALALHAGQPWPRFWRRWAQVAACALLVSLLSALMFPRSWIWFGVLHGMLAMLLVCRLAAPLRGWLWALGALALVLPHVARWPLFDAPALYWLGLIRHKPVTQDWVPLFPWLGVMLWGLAAGQWLLRTSPLLLHGRLPTTLQPLAALGRRPLSFYMLHQPVLFGFIVGGRWAGGDAGGAAAGGCRRPSRRQGSRYDPAHEQQAPVWLSRRGRAPEDGPRVGQ